jgi:hypothetical protein
MMSALASIIDSNEATEIQAILDQVVDPVGTFHRFSLPSSTFGRVQP